MQRPLRASVQNQDCTSTQPRVKSRESKAWGEHLCLSAQSDSSPLKFPPQNHPGSKNRTPQTRPGRVNRAGVPTRSRKLIRDAQIADRGPKTASRRLDRDPKNGPSTPSLRQAQGTPFDSAQGGHSPSTPLRANSRINNISPWPFASVPGNPTGMPKPRPAKPSGIQTADTSCIPQIAVSDCAFCAFFYGPRGRIRKRRAPDLPTTRHQVWFVAGGPAETAPLHQEVRILQQRERAVQSKSGERQVVS